MYIISLPVLIILHNHMCDVNSVLYSGVSKRHLVGVYLLLLVATIRTSHSFLLLHFFYFIKTLPKVSMEP